MEWQTIGRGQKSHTRATSWVDKKEEKAYSSCGNEKAPFISAGDIAAVAFHVVTHEKLDEIDYRVPGLELLIHRQVHHIENTDTTATGNPDVAEKLSKEFGRKIEATKLTKDKSARRWAEINHAPQPLAKFMATLETMTADKGERE